MNANKVVLIIDQNDLRHITGLVREDEVPSFWAAIDNAVAVDEVGYRLQSSRRRDNPFL